MMTMSVNLKALVDEARKHGTLAGLPDRHFIAHDFGEAALCPSFPAAAQAPTP